MSLSKTLRFFAIITWLLFLAFPSQANTNPRNPGKTSDQEQLQEQQEDQEQSEDQITKEEDERVERSDSNSSLNYIFYMIYKVKFQDLFRFPDRSSPQKGAGLSLI